ncbi:helix-turn-helix transcriptional regulator [Dialister sp.]|uniref:helix-turn-helix transcriptional regulator n=1 Tax=Dialister sp. TaxID=1955814 RepID=UPI002E81CB50|nr:WYL domain-containing protein [Dialister sp.]MEE3452565.1 WYL domain-containing protein [Dialister sp.]
MNEKREKDDLKTEHMMYLWDILSRGGVLTKAEVAEKFNIHIRTVSRYFEDIRRHLDRKNTETGLRQQLIYDRNRKVYRIENLENSMISPGELLGICKILIASRALSKKKLTSLMSRLLQTAVCQSGQEDVKTYMKHELFDYRDPCHAEPDVESMWHMIGAINKHHVIRFRYKGIHDVRGKIKEVQPEGMVFSEYYFYLLGTPTESGAKGKEETRVYRVDRMHHIEDTGETFDVAYSSRLREGVFKNSIQYMYPGELQQVRFIYSGPSLEAVLDRLPTAEARQQKDGTWLVTDMIQGDGIVMWFLSQGSMVEVLYPESLRKKWLAEAEKIVEMGKCGRAGKA